MTDQARTAPAAKKLFIKTYGCQMNVYDSERMAEALGAEGYVQTDDAGRCGHDPAEHLPYPRKGGGKGVFRPGPLKPLKAANPDLKIGVAGCVAQAEGAEIIRRSRWSIWSWARNPITACPTWRPRGAGPKASIRTSRPRTSSTTCPNACPRPPRPRGLSDRAGRLRQVLRLLRGALYPRGRGQPPRRPHPAEARGLVERGVREITLLGQNVNAWHGVGRMAANGALAA